MRRVVNLLCALSLSLGVTAWSTPKDQVCGAIQQAISDSSAVYHPSDAAYAQDIWHYMNSSTQNSMCTVEPGTVGDVSKIVCYTAKFYSLRFKNFSHLDENPRELRRSFWGECRDSNPLKGRSSSHQHRRNVGAMRRTMGLVLHLAASSPS